MKLSDEDIKEFLDSLPDHDKDDWYMSSEEIATEVIKWLKEFMSKKYGNEGN